MAKEHYVNKGAKTFKTALDIGIDLTATLFHRFHASGHKGGPLELILGIR